MYKNIILDIGGVLFDDSLDNINKLLDRDSSLIYKKCYSGEFKECLLGNITVNQFIESFKDDKDYETIKYILSFDNLSVTYPIIKDNYKYILDLKSRGFNIYFISNITSDSYKYIDNLIDFSQFSGGIFSCFEGLIKPNNEIYSLLISRYSLKKEECIFFDDSKKNVDACSDIGIKSIKFNSISDIKNNLI